MRGKAHRGERGRVVDSVCQIGFCTVHLGWHITYAAACHWASRPLSADRVAAHVTHSADVTAYGCTACERAV